MIFKRLLSGICLSLFVSSLASAQTVGINTENPHESAALEVVSSERGVLIPRMTTPQRDAILNPANGLLVYNSTINGFEFYNGSTWVLLSNQTLGLSGTDLSISGGNTVDLSALQDGTGTDNQTLTLSGSNLSISGGNSVVLPTGADDLGNHTLSENLKTNTFYISGNGGNEGLFIANNGKVAQGHNNPEADFDVNGNIKVANKWSAADLKLNSLYAKNTTDGFALGIGTTATTFFSWDNAQGQHKMVDWWNDGSRVILGRDGAKVGIGIEDPTYQLEIAGGEFATPGLYTSANKIISRSANGTGLSFDNFGHIRIFGNGGGYSRFSSHGNGVGLRLAGSVSSQTDRSVIEMINGDFGSKFSASSGAQTFLSVGGEINQSGSAGYSMLKVNANENSTGSGSNRLLDLRTDDTEQFIVKSDGFIGMGTTTPFVAGTDAELRADGARFEAVSTTANPARFGLWANNGKYFTIERNTTNTRIFGNTSLQLGSNIAQNAVVISSVGKVGINEANPTENLHINGSFKLVDGTQAAGRVLTSDANGVATWQASSSGGSDAIIDSDSDTKVESESSSDNDEVHFTLGGTKRWIMKGSRLEPQNSGQSIHIGENAGLNDANVDKRQVFIGHNAGYNTTDGNSSIALGHSALYHNASGAYNIGLGADALFHQQHGYNNLAIGHAAGKGSFNHSKSANVYIGNESGFVNGGSQNVFVGYRTGYNGTSTTGSVFIGHRVGENEVTSNKLYIDNSNTSAPLIYGDFATNEFKINGSIGVGDAYTLPITDGSANEVLTTDGSGNVSWQAANGSGSVKGFVVKGNTQSIPNTTNTYLSSFNTTEKNDFSENVAADGTFTVPAGEGGWYQVSGYVSLESNGKKGGILSLRLNESETLVAARDVQSFNSIQHLSVSTSVFLSAGDRISLMVFQGAGGSRNVTSARMSGLKF